MFVSFGDDGTMALKEIPEGHHADLAWPGNPSQIASHYLQAYYHNIFNSNVPDSKCFRWKPSLTAGGYIPSTILVGASCSTPTVPEKTSKEEAATKSNQPGKRLSSSKKSEKRPSVAMSDDKDEISTASKKWAATRSANPAKHLSSFKMSKKPPSAGMSDDKSEMSTASDTASPGESQDSSNEEQTDSNDGNPTPPDVQRCQRMPVLLKTSHLSKPTDMQSPLDSSQHQSSKTKDKGKAVDPAE